MKKNNLIFAVFAASCFLSGLFLSCGGSSSSARQIEVWDFGGVEEEGAVNKISISDLDSISDETLAQDGKFKKGDIQFGDLILNTENNDRAYYGDEGVGKKNYGTQGYASTQFDDGYTSNGMYYANGKGGENRRYVVLEHVFAGDVISFYARTSNAGDETIHFASVDEEKTEQKEGEGANPRAFVKNNVQDETAPLNAEAQKYTYIAISDGTYKIYADSAVGKPVFFRVVRTPGVLYSGKIGGASGGSLSFIVKETNQEISAKINGSKWQAGLPAGYTLTAILKGVQGKSISSDTRLLSVKEESAGKAETANLIVEDAKTYKATGTVKIDSAAAKNLSVIFNPPEGGVYQSVKASFDSETLLFSADLEPGVSYTATIEGANDFFISSGEKFDFSEDANQDILTEKKAVYEVSGSFIGENSVIPEKIEFVNLSDGYRYSGKIEGNSFSANLRDGAYEINAESAVAKTANHVVVNEKNVKKDVNLVAKSKKTETLALRKSLSVGKAAEFKTVGAALRAAKAMNPTSEDERITISIAPGVYREQITIDVPFITLKSTGSGEVKLTWYYGIAYNYYSSDKDGWFDSDLFYDKFSKKGVAKWGGATYVKKEAKAFRADGITFETSFNKYMTDEEIADGVEADGSLNFSRKLNSDVRSKAATERSAAILIEADETEFKNCRFLGSQDTLYTGSGIKGYFSSCFIEGQTDFIFGDGSFVFENCEIRWCGYTDKRSAGYITAARTSGDAKGYLFLNCVISRDDGTLQSPGFFGRPWGADANVTFINTILGSDENIDDKGWTQMSGNKPENAHFREINTIWGDELDFDERVKGTVQKDDGSAKTEQYLGSWKPVFLSSADSNPVFSRNPSFTTDDDINTPYPGHTITLHYSLSGSPEGDMSLIRWYRIENGKETLIKQTAGFADKTYLLTADDSGSKIKAVVLPKTKSGEGSAKEVILDATVNEGYAIPANVAADRPRTSGAVNVFLAGDSTVKDYSARGMWSGGQTRNEGAWGEFLQDFFNSAVAVQNYANGGRSTRNFINEGSLQKIADSIEKSDFLFIQFGHNDCSNQSGYLEDRYVPLGQPDGNGRYPVTEGKKVQTPASYKAKYGDEFYAWDSGGTYKWFLKQYIDVARKAGATPVLVTPVSRLYFTNGKIRPHHDSTDTSTNTLTTSGNAYVEAVRQLATEENVILLDGFEITKSLYEKAFADAGSDKKARELMFQGDSTHNNKLGGFVIAGEFARAIKRQIPVLAKSIVRPKKALGENADGSILFTVDSEGNFSCDSDYWKAAEAKTLSEFGK